MTSQSIRAQVNLDRKFGRNHEVTAIAGIDGKEVVTDINFWRLYGFNENIGTSTAVNYEMNYPKYGNLAAAGRIPYVDRYNKLTDIYFSYFTNAAYSYKGRYTVSGSARIDQSNLFGVNTNQKSVPLWSLGGAWIASKESFLQRDWIDLFKLRTTFGYNGNIDRTVSAYATGAFLTGATLTGAPFVLIQTPPNPELRWERIAMWNIGADFSFLKGSVFGSVEYYSRKGTDILGYAPLDPTVGMDQFKGNVANITGRGIDVDLTFRAGRRVQWTGNLLFSISRDKVTEYNRTVSLSNYMQSAGGELGTTNAFTPIVGQPIYGIYSYPWGGLDPENGDPLVRIEEGTDKEYAALFSSTDFSQLVYHGNARPTHFGAFRNTLVYKGISLSVNLTYKFGYYFRRPSINYTSLAGSWLGHPDYKNRWKQPGDELNTDVPSFTYPLNANRNNFFGGSEVLVEKGDHIRLQDIRIGYDIRSVIGIKNIHIYTYVNNLGILWKSTDTNIDPDFVVARFLNPATFAVGINCNF
ncbi:TonB-dependent receptor [Sphingobacterium sp. KU25419]|nr:TonB-dependent receptor [Sphingobacterium sp. KU25419]